MRHSRTEIVIFMNTALIDSLPKNQVTIEACVFRAEFVGLIDVIE